MPVSNCSPQRFYGTYSPFQLFDSYADITSEVINKILVNQKIFITQEELDKLKGIPGVKFDLPLNDETSRAFIALVGRQRSQKSGVYIFTHNESGSKYVGSSNNLFFRLFDYFRHDAKSDYTGLLLPMLRKQGLGAFSLEIFIIPAEFSKNSYLYLEQYHLLNKKFDLNTQRTVQFRALRPHKIYLYDSEGKILYYSCDSYSKLQKDLGIHYTTFKKCLQQGNNYLIFFKITDTPLFFIKKRGEDGKNSVATAGLNLIQLNSLIAEKQMLKNKSMTFSGKRYSNSKSILIKEVTTGNIRDFTNILTAVSYLEDINNKINRNTITKYLNTGKPFKGYLFYEKKQVTNKIVRKYSTSSTLSGSLRREEAYTNGGEHRLRLHKLGGGVIWVGPQKRYRSTLAQSEGGSALAPGSTLVTSQSNPSAQTTKISKTSVESQALNSTAPIDTSVKKDSLEEILEDSVSMRTD